MILAIGASRALCSATVSRCADFNVLVSSVSVTRPISLGRVGDRRRSSLPVGLTSGASGRLLAAKGGGLQVRPAPPVRFLTSYDPPFLLSLRSPFLPSCDSVNVCEWIFFDRFPLMGYLRSTRDTKSPEGGVAGSTRPTTGDIKAIMDINKR